jgi:hypothetical protein
VSLRFDIENDEAAVEEGARLFKVSYSARQQAHKEPPIIGVLFRGPERLACFRFVNDKFVTELREAASASPTLAGDPMPEARRVT